MTRWLIGDLRTGRRLLDLNVVSGSWSTEVNGPGAISVTVTLNDPDMKRLGLRNAATVGKSFLAVEENGNIMNAGPIWAHDYDKDNGTLSLTAAGLWTYFDHRVLVPTLASATDPVSYPLYADTTFTNLWYGTWAKRLVQQAQTHTGGNVPVVFQADEAGTTTTTYLGADLALVGDALNDIVALSGGPDLEFAPRYTGDRLGIEWVFRAGTVAQPQLFSSSTFVWDYAVPTPTIQGLTVKVNADSMASRAWVTGGRSVDKALYARYDNASLTDAGYPLLESVNSSNSTESDPAVLGAYAVEMARVGSKPTEFWSFRVQATVTPQVGDYRAGDYCLIKIANDPYIDKGQYRRRIMSMSGDEQGDWVSITTGEVYSL